MKENMARAFYLTAVELEDRKQERLARQFAFWAYSLYTYLEGQKNALLIKHFWGNQEPKQEYTLTQGS